MTRAELVALLKPIIHQALGGDGWAYSNYGGDELVDCADRLEEAALAAIATIAEALRVPSDAMTMEGSATLREPPPFPQQYIATGTRTVNGEKTQVWLGWSQQDGGWYQWDTSESAARHFATEADAARAAAACPGPFYNEPAKDSVRVVAVENSLAHSYRRLMEKAPGHDYWNANACWRAMLAASPLVQEEKQ